MSYKNTSVVLCSASHIGICVFWAVSLCLVGVPPSFQRQSPKTSIIGNSVFPFGSNTMNELKTIAQNNCLTLRVPSIMCRSWGADKLPMPPPEKNDLKNDGIIELHEESDGESVDDNDLPDPLQSKKEKCKKLLIPLPNSIWKNKLNC